MVSKTNGMQPSSIDPLTLPSYSHDIGQIRICAIKHFLYTKAFNGYQATTLMLGTKIVKQLPNGLRHFQAHMHER